jgi:hypothetical protein
LQELIELPEGVGFEIRFSCKNYITNAGIIAANSEKSIIVRSKRLPFDFEYG